MQRLGKAKDTQDTRIDTEHRSRPRARQLRNCGHAASIRSYTHCRAEAAIADWFALCQH
jgi:hypothetical protein